MTWKLNRTLKMNKFQEYHCETKKRLHTYFRRTRLALLRRNTRAHKRVTLPH